MATAIGVTSNCRGTLIGLMVDDQFTEGGLVATCGAWSRWSWTSDYSLISTIKQPCPGKSDKVLRTITALDWDKEPDA